MSKTMTLPIKHGAYDCHTPPDALKFLLPSVAEERSSLIEKLEKVTARRASLKDVPREDNNPLAQEYRTLGREICEINQRLNVLNTEFQKQAGESFESMFVRAAKNVLLPEEFERLKRYAFQMLREFQEQTHLNEG